MKCFAVLIMDIKIIKFSKSKSGRCKLTCMLPGPVRTNQFAVLEVVSEFCDYDFDSLLTNLVSTPPSSLLV